MEDVSLTIGRFVNKGGEGDLVPMRAKKIPVTVPPWADGEEILTKAVQKWRSFVDRKLPDVPYALYFEDGSRVERYMPGT